MGAGVVWVLGAGFSAGLGAPLLNGLLSEHAIKEVKLRFPAKPMATSDTALRMVRMFAKGGEKGTGMWGDAEQFMDYVDVARNDSVRAELIRNLDTGLATAPNEWASSLKRFMAARVCTFLEGANLGSELWQPYIRWARALQPEDTIITFNWDRVLELIAEGHSKLPSSPRLGNPATMSLTPKSFTRDSSGGLRVLKLHGSVDWKRREATYEPMDDPLTALECKPEEIAIATPGPAKKDASDGFLAPLWNEAKTALMESAAVVFLGYRFPPSDSQARESLLEGLSAPGSEIGHTRAIHTVLGPDVRSEHSARLAGLIRGMLDGVGWVENDGVTDGKGPRYTFRQHPLYGQDFMSVFSRDRILEPFTPPPTRGMSWPR